MVMVRCCSPWLQQFSSAGANFMAAPISIPSSSFHHCSASLPSSTSISCFHSSSTISANNENSLRRVGSKLKTFAKFEKFQDEPDNLEGNNSPLSLSSEPEPAVAVEEDEEDDSCLPPDLEGAVRQSGEAAALFLSSGGTRAIVELLLPQLQFLDEEGAQGELWELSRIFLDTLMEKTGGQRIKAVFPDAGAAALLTYKWKDAAFGFASLSDRKPVEKEDDIVVMVVPDYQMLESVERIASVLSDDPPRPLIMWNPRLISGDVGVGFNVRKLRRYFLSTFTTVYSMKPLPTGAVFRCYPGLWKVFSDDKDRPNRYLLAKEMVSRPDAEELEIIFGNVEENSDRGPSLFSRAAGVFSSLSRFMRAIS